MYVFDILTGCLFLIFDFSCGLIIDKECPNFTPVEDFDLFAFGEGVWHEVARYPNEFENSNCASYGFEKKDDKKIFVRLLDDSKVPEDSPDYLETIVEIDPEAGNKGILLHEITYGNPRTTFTMREYVLAINYDTFYISSECNYDPQTNTTYEYAWVATRSKDYGDEVKAAIDSYLKTSKDIDASKFVWLDLHDESC